MRKFRLIFGTSSIVLLSFLLFLISACKKDKLKYNDSTLIRPCDNVICLNGGTCKNGLCFCPAGFEGNDCETKWNEKFIGKYIADDACFSDSLGFYEVVINGDVNNASKIIFNNLGTFCSDKKITATINPEKTSFYFPMQNTCGDLYLSGYGNKNGDFIHINLVARDSANHTSNSCSIILDEM
jgi:hypothetical protein